MIASIKNLNVEEIFHDQNHIRHIPYFARAGSHVVLWTEPEIL